MWMEIWTAKTLGIPDRGEFPEQLTVYIINGIIAQWLERTPGSVMLQVQVLLIPSVEIYQWLKENHFV